jgi:hypothetical protein
MERLDELRIEALRLALPLNDASADEIVSRAEVFLKFLTSSSLSSEGSAQGSEAPAISCEARA